MVHTKRSPYPHTPDGRYFVVRGRLWRLSKPDLTEDERLPLVADLMNARRAVRDAGTDADAKAEARKRVNAAKIALGESGPVWWDDGSPDYNRKLVANTPYEAWLARRIDDHLQTVGLGTHRACCGISAG